MLRSKARNCLCSFFGQKTFCCYQEAPSGCPPRFYQSVALSVLACFVEDEDIMTDASVLFNMPELIFIIENSDSEEYEVHFIAFVLIEFLQIDFLNCISGRCYAS